MDGAVENRQLLRLAAKYICWTSAEITASDGLNRLVANVMEMGAWGDAHGWLEIVGAEIFRDILKSPPIGVLSDKSLAF